MQGTQITRRLRNFTFAAATAMVLGGCFLEEEIEDPLAEVEFVNNISGSVGDGPVVGAAMRVLANDGTLLEEFESDATAGFNVDIRTKGKFYPLSIDARNGVDLVTGLAPDFTLSGAALEPGKKSVANINPFSTMAMEMALDMPGGLSKLNLETAEGTVTAVLGSGLSTLMDSGPMNTTIDASNVAEIVKSSEALGEIVRRTRNWLLIAGFGVSGDWTVQAIGSDLTDGVINGAGGPRANAHAAVFANILSAQVLLEAAANELHVNDQLATAKLESAIRQIGYASPSPSLGELTVTQQMLDQIDVGLAVAEVVSSDGTIADLRQLVAGIVPGSTPAAVSAVLPSNYRQSLDGVMTTMASADDQTIAEANDIVSTGSTEPSGGTDPEPTQNRSPAIQGTPDTSVNAGNAYQFAPSASDPDGDALVFSIENKPSWATFDVNTGLLSGLPVESDVGQYPGIAISVTDGELTASLAPFDVTVVSSIVNSAPTISGTPETVATEGETYSFVPSASDVDGDELTFSITGKPSWLGFNTSTGALNGKPATADVGVSSSIVISVTDGQETASLAAFTITVNSSEPPPPSNTAPTISGSPPGVVTEGETYGFVPTASDADGDSLTFSISGMPPWLSFSTSTGGLHGVPSASDVGIHGNIVISVTDGAASTSLPAFSITVEAAEVNTPPTISGSPPSTVTANSAYSFTPTASDADGDTLSFSASGLPSWISLNSSNGTISGTPDDGDVGTYEGIRIIVSDGSESASLGPFSITVESVSLGSVTLSWDAPMENADGSALTDLAGYKLYWGTTPGNYTNSITIDNPGITRYVVENLAPGTYEFASTAFNTGGVESDYSNVATKIVE